MTRDMWIGLVWIAACVAGGYAAMGGEFTPGRLGPPQPAWPPESRMARSPGAPTIVAFVHPQCGCTKATITHLVRVAASHPDAGLLVPVFVPPRAAGAPGWLDGAQTQAIRRAVPRARILPDAGGIEARRFGALTSGTVLVYAADGRELFRGGITNRRGGAEDNPGLRQLTQVLEESSRPSRAASTPVFGCPLVDEARGATS